MAKNLVLQLIETDDPGGAEQVLLDLAVRLGAEYRSEAALIREGWISNALRSRGVPVTMLRYNSNGSFSSLNDFTTLWDLVSLIQEKHVSVIHAHEFFMNTLGVMASRITGIPIVATVHGKNYYADRFRRRLSYRLVAMLAGHMVAVSEDTRHFLQKRIGIPIERITVVPNGVPEYERPSQENTSLLRKSLGLGQSSRVVGAVGSLSLVKGHRYLLDAAVSVVSRFPSVVFLIVGSGGCQEELKSQVDRLGIAPYVRFLGYRDDVRDLLALFDIFTLPSLSEGMPLALLEAMAARVPPVATRVGGVHEVIEHGHTGLLVRPGDSGGLAESIVTLLDNPTIARKIGESAQQLVTTRYSLKGMLTAYQDIYSELTDTRPFSYHQNVRWGW